MSRVFSFRDLRLIPELSKYNEIQLLHPSMDAVINAYLSQLGFDMNHAIFYVPAKHRDMQGKIDVGFRAIGEISDDRAFITSKLCTITERLVAASHTDPSLCKELSSLMGNSISYRDVEDNHDGEESYPEDLVEPDFDEVAQEILNLENLRDQIRGTPHDEAGALKLPGTYA